MSMVIYRIAAFDKHTVYQAQHALTEHQKQIITEPWFTRWVFEHLVRQILELTGEGNLDWEGTIETWELFTNE